MQHQGDLNLRAPYRAGAVPDPTILTERHAAGADDGDADVRIELLGKLLNPPDHVIDKPHLAAVGLHPRGDPVGMIVGSDLVVGRLRRVLQRRRAGDGGAVLVRAGRVVIPVFGVARIDRFLAVIQFLQRKQPAGSIPVTR